MERCQKRKVRMTYDDSGKRAEIQALTGKRLWTYKIANNT